MYNVYSLLSTSNTLAVLGYSNGSSCNPNEPHIFIYIPNITSYRQIKSSSAAHEIQFFFSCLAVLHINDDIWAIVSNICFNLLKWYGAQYLQCLLVFRMCRAIEMHDFAWLIA